MSVFAFVSGLGPLNPWMLSSEIRKKPVRSFGLLLGHLGMQKRLGVDSKDLKQHMFDSLEDA